MAEMEPLTPVILIPFKAPRALDVASSRVSIASSHGTWASPAMVATRKLATRQTILG